MALNETSSISNKGSIQEKIHNSFLDNVRPILLVLRMFGRFPYGISENDIQPLTKTSPIAAYSFLSFIISLYMVGKTVDLLTDQLATSGSYKETILCIIGIIFLIHYPLIPFIDWLVAPTMIKYIRLWHRYECLYKEEFASFPSKHVIQFLCYAFVPPSIYFSYFAGFKLFGNSFFISIVYFPLTFGLYQYGLLWCLCQYYLIRQIRKLKGIVISEGLQNRVERTRKCWLLLSELTSCTGDSVGMLLVPTFLTGFLVLITYSYIFFTSFLEAESNFEWTSGILITFGSIMFYILFDSADRTTKEMGINFYSVVFDQKFSLLDEENLNQLALLLATFSSHPPIVKFGGLMVANRQLFVSLVCNALTYLIVLVQFNA